MNTNMEALNWAMKVRNLDPVSWKLLVKLASRVNSERGDFDVWPSNRQIADDAEISVASVKRRLATLVEAGCIKIVPRQREDGSTTSNLVRLMVHAKHLMPGGETIEVDADSMDPKAAWQGGVQIEGGAQIEPGGESKLCTGAQVTAEPCNEPLNRTSEGEDSPPSPYGEATPTGESDLFGQSIANDMLTPLWQNVELSWNAMSAQHPGIASITAMTPTRRNMIGTRAREIVREFARRGEAVTEGQVWERIFAAIPRSTFLLGKAPPGKGRTSPFRLNIDYVLRQKEFLRILEGGYDDDERYRNREFDAASGRTFSPAEAATRGALSRLGSLGARRDDRGNPRGPERGNEGGAAGGSAVLSGRNRPVPNFR